MSSGTSVVVFSWIVCSHLFNKNRIWSFATRIEREERMLLDTLAPTFSRVFKGHLGLRGLRGFGVLGI